MEMDVINTEEPSQTHEHHGEMSLEQIQVLIRSLSDTKHVMDTLVDILEDKSQQLRPPHRKSWWGRHCFPQKRRIVYRNIVVITLVLQVLNLVILTFLDAWPKRKESMEFHILVASAMTMIALQVLNLALVILASGRLAKQIYKHSVNGLLLGQCYLATIMLFAGIYTLTFRLEKRSWKFIAEDMSSDPAQVFLLYAKFLFYSISTATLCGSDNVLPVYMYNCIFAGCQMLLSFCYFASILGLGLTSPSPSQTSLPSAESASAQDTASNDTNATNCATGGGTNTTQQANQEPGKSSKRRQTSDDRSRSRARVSTSVPIRSPRNSEESCIDEVDPSPSINSVSYIRVSPNDRPNRYGSIS